MNLNIAMIGTRGVPASYGGFETAVEEVGKRLVARGHDVVVYRRGAPTSSNEYLGMRLVTFPALRRKQLETLSHTAISVGHQMIAPSDVAFVFNAANSPFVPTLRMRGVPTAVHVDGLEWRRAKWSGAGRRYYKWAEQRAVHVADALIADAPGIADYYRHQFDVPTELIRYGAPVITATDERALDQWHLASGRYHLVVARFEPENHVLEAVRGYTSSTARMPLVVVGATPYSSGYQSAIDEAARGDDRVRMLGSVFDQNALDALYAHAYSYIHGHSVGGTNPSLLRAMGAGSAVLAFDVGFNREVLDEADGYFSTAGDVSSVIEWIEADPEGAAARGRRAQARVASTFDWDSVADAYESLAERLAGGHSIHAVARGRRRQGADWDPTTRSTQPPSENA